MENNPYGIVALWYQGGWVIRFVAFVLLAMSVLSWAIIVIRLRRAWRLYGIARQVSAFWDAPAFDKGLALLDTPPQGNAFHDLAKQGRHAAGHYTRNPEKLAKNIGFSEWLTEHLRGVIDDSMARMQGGLTVLASIGATAPFVGLFGTVWGIYHALVAIGISGEASIDRIAGPVGESLIMTALGLAVAIPALLGYNALLRINRYFSAELNRFARQLYGWFLTGLPAGSGMRDDREGN